MSDVENTQSSDTGEEQTPDPVPYDRFKEVNDQRKAAAEALEQERQSRTAMEAHMASLQQTLEKRLPAQQQEPDEDIYVDPAERAAAEALKEARAAREEAGKLRDENERRNARESIDIAVASHEFEDPEDVRERLALGFFVNRGQGTAFNASAEAKVLFDKENERLAKREQARIDKKKQVEAATASAMIGSSPPTMGSISTSEMPAWGTPERADWDKAEVKAILEQSRIG
tara:strand:- start:2867 stop:3556 length:690 start_codon:yes stop_codon:yes gene_type:complete